jgi:integrase
LTVGKSKTEAGSGSGIPLSTTALACLKEWRSQFPDCQPSHFVFPTEGYAAKSDEAAGETTVGRAVYGTDPTKPILSWKSGWTVARKTAQVSCRWHDLRHCFVSALSERKASDATIKALSGHISNKMLERYSHTRNEAKRAAIAVFDDPGRLDHPQIPQHSAEAKFDRFSRLLFLIGSGWCARRDSNSRPSGS